MEYLKDSYKWSLKTVAVLNVAVFWGIVNSSADISAIAEIVNSISLKDGLIAILAPIGTFVLNGLISADAKARLVYWRWKNPLPGSRAFSKYLKVESRADPDCLTGVWGVLPNDPVEQNRLWYRIYRTVDQEVRVREAHRASLFSRDLAAFGALFLIIFGIATFFTDATWYVSMLYLLTLLLQYIVLVIAARTYGVRFVCTVLAIASHEETRIVT